MVKTPTTGFPNQGAIGVSTSKETISFKFLSFSNICVLNFNVDAVCRLLQSSRSPMFPSGTSRFDMKYRIFHKLSVSRLSQSPFLVSNYFRKQCFDRSQVPKCPTNKKTELQLLFYFKYSSFNISQIVTSFDENVNSKETQTSVSFLDTLNPQYYKTIGNTNCLFQER